MTAVAAPALDHVQSGGPRYVAAIDGSRGVGALFVIIAHYGYAQTGWVSVQYFFVLSGFLITTILLSQRDKPLKSYLRTFYWRRALRIFPLYFGYLGICTITYLWFREPSAFGDNWLYLYTYTYNLYVWLGGRPLEFFFTHLWSLSAEEQFYFIWPFVIFFARGRSLKWILFALLVVIPLSRFGAHYYAMRHGIRPQDVGIGLYVATMFQFDGFAAGAAIAYLRLDRWKSAHRVFVALFLVTVAYAIYAMVVYPPPVIHGEIDTTNVTATVRQGLSFGFPLFMVPRAQYVWGYSVMNALSALLIISMCHPNFLTRFLENRFLCYVGKLSYGIYVLHLPILHFFGSWFDINPWSWQGAGLLVLYAAAVIGAAHLSFHYFEKFFLDLKEARFSSTRPAKSARSGENV
jgi:peptidoglycan/LPS O-acetylase OafA/YrhL